ncbi:MAG: hypothetical protein AAF557_08835 [Pseudomonadota bacterium]
MRAVIALSLLAAPALAAEDGLIHKSCLARDIGIDVECACLQQVADDHVRVSIHSVIADYLGQQVSVAEIAAIKGHSGAEAFYDAIQVFKRHAKDRCAFDLP